ncbi:hypothetical protein LJC26_08185 [Desulfovibrio sp. OttesenSCG-928-O18]|nr:hypothetical protein [Desulfovibrio sp. OttesenSCG-928-O18]
MDSYISLSAGLLLIISGLLTVFTGEGGTFHGFPVPAWTGPPMAALGVFACVLSIRALRQNKGEKTTYTDEDVERAKADLERMCIREHGVLPEVQKDEEKAKFVGTMSEFVCAVIAGIIFVIVNFLSILDDGEIYRGFYLPVWIYWGLLLTGVFLIVFGIKGILRKRKEIPPVVDLDEQVERAKADLERMYIREHREPPEAPKGEAEGK